MTEDEKKYVDDLIINALSVQTDEAEGQQVIDLDALNLCAVDYATDLDLPNIYDTSLSETDIINNIFNDENLVQLLTTEPDDLPNIIDDIQVKNNVIIEFSDATVKQPNPVNFILTVKPGEEINENTILGFVEQEGKQKKIKSIFSKGKVLGNDDNSDYKRLFPSRCNRHIILENTVPESGNSYDISLKVEELNQEFKDEACLYNLITTNMCQSLLPFVLSRRYRGIYYSQNITNNITNNNTNNNKYITFPISTYYRVPNLIKLYNNEWNETEPKYIVKNIKRLLQHLRDIKFITSQQYEQLEKTINEKCHYYSIYIKNNHQYTGNYIIDDLLNKNIGSKQNLQKYINKQYIGLWELKKSDVYENSLSELNISNVISNTSTNKHSLIYNNIRFEYSIDKHDNGIKIFNDEILQKIEDYQNKYGANVLSDNLSPEQIKSWKKRAKKKKNRNKVKKEINQVASNSVDKIKHSNNPKQEIDNQKDRIINARQEYIDNIIKLYNDKENISYCKFDANYTDCKYLVNDKIDTDILKNVQSTDDFQYTSIGDDSYFNYYMSVLMSINLNTDDDYTKEFYNLILDIINKRLIIENKDIKTQKSEFIKLFNTNIRNDNSNYNYNNETYINNQFISFDNKLSVFVNTENKKYIDNIKVEFKKQNLPDNAVLNAGQLYTDSNKYRQVCDYIKSMCSSEDENDYIITQLATMYMYLKSGDNKYKSLKVDRNDKYLYFKLVKEESEKIIKFWDKIIKIYINDVNLNKCIEDTYSLSNTFNDYATWPLGTDFNIQGIQYKHYLFEYIPEKTISNTDISIGDYSFPNSIELPDIPDTIDVNEEEALNDLNNPEVIEPKKDDITIFDLEYWQRYFILASIISIPYLNCGLDIPPYIMLVPFPCFFFALGCVYIPFFNLIIVMGLTLRGIYFSPIILYINTSDAPSSILTPLIGIVNKFRNIFNNQIDQMSIMPIKQIVNMYIKKLNNENNKLERENKKLGVYQGILKNVQFPNTETIKREFAEIIDPSIDLRQKYISLDRLASR